MAVSLLYPRSQWLLNGPPRHGCAGWARNPKGPQITFFVTKWVAVASFGTWGPRPGAEFRCESRQGRPTLSISTFFSPFWSQKCQHVIFCDFFENGHPHRGRIWADLDPRGPRGPQGGPVGPLGPRGPLGPQIHCYGSRINSKPSQKTDFWQCLGPNG